MIRILAVLAAVAVLVFIVYQKNSEEPVLANDQRIETGWGGLDSLVADSLPNSTEATIAGGMGESAEFLRGWGSSTVSEVQSFAERR